jgi:hypothetical protein
MDEADNLRRQAKRALRLAGAVFDRQATQALEAHAATLLARAQSLNKRSQFCPPSYRSRNRGVSPRRKNNRLRSSG